MTPKEVAQALDNRILAYLHNLASSLAANKIFTHKPIHVWEDQDEFYEWWLLVYPWTRVTKPPENALILKVWFNRMPGRYVKIVAELETVGGMMLENFENGPYISLDKADISEFEAEFERFEDPASMDRIRSRIEAYIQQTRADDQAGPRDWSPRWGMKGSEKKKPEPIRVNIVEQKEWKDNWTWDSSDFDERIQRLMDEYSRNLFQEENELESLVEDIMGHFYSSKASDGPREWSPKGRKIGDEGVKKVSKGLREGRHGLPEVDNLIRDTIQYMYEDALMPDDGDIQHALRQARDEFIDDPDLDYELWDPLLEKGRDRQDIMIQLMNETAYGRAQQAYDRYIVFDFMNSGVVENLVKAWPVKDRGALRRDLESEFKALRDGFMREFFRKLEKDMRDAEPENRTEWRKHWKAMLGQEDRVNAARKDIWKYLETAPELPDEEEVE